MSAATIFDKLAVIFSIFQFHQEISNSCWWVPLRSQTSFRLSSDFHWRQSYFNQINDVDNANKLPSAESKITSTVANDIEYPAGIQLDTNFKNHTIDIDGFTKAGSFGLSKLVDRSCVFDKQWCFDVSILLMFGISNQQWRQNQYSLWLPKQCSIELEQQGQVFTIFIII